MDGCTDPSISNHQSMVDLMMDQWILRSIYGWSKLQNVSQPLNVSSLETVSNYC